MSRVWRPRRKQPDNPESTGPMIPDDLWVKCERCRELIYVREFERQLYVCPRCGYHARLTAQQRIATLVDHNTFTAWDTDLITGDPLQFVALGESYREKARQTAQRIGENEALVTGQGSICGVPVAIAVTEFRFFGASMGAVFGEKLVRLVERACERRLPVVTVSSSGGARMQEGAVALMQLARTIAAFRRLTDQQLPHIAVLVDPCYGGVTASYATSADVIFAEPGAMIGFAGPRVIEQVTRQKLPKGFQTAEFLLAHGMIDAVVQRRELPQRIATVISVLQGNRQKAKERPVVEGITQ
ncbi:acetyl-CoA carboxylase, carboxyltransferase subunit beta [Thermorudis peleae]|uniref:acetyl-CoA carboxylase, carboxyltransferase subunit beta n=1 Tax=Thermorudis peleae TaxID=1382356 RepID=UPI00056DC7AE|nr:acetyl-CoA carboxylase, carboxyltransferase subunit beta [Thermorudis peleae]MBX6753718.1 acetyl-CoA carboxylase carboxyltransferase subunit beta [Thermorudis peleae]